MEVKLNVRKKIIQGIEVIMNLGISPFPSFRNYNETVLTGHAKILDSLDSGGDPRKLH